MDPRRGTTEIARERLLIGQERGEPREEDFALPSRKGGVKWIARRRWMVRQGFFYHAIAVMPETCSTSADVARFLGSLETVPIAVDRRGLTPAWTRKTSKEEGFTVLWPERFDDTVICVVPTPTRSAMNSTYFVFQRSMGFAVTVVRYHSGTIMHPVNVPIEEAEAWMTWRDRFLSESLRTIRGFHPSASRTRTLMNEAVRDCLVTGYEDLIASPTLLVPRLESRRRVSSSR